MEVIGICLDDASARVRTQQLLKNHGVNWPQRFEGVGFSTDAYRLLYVINSLPTVWLLDKQGIVVDSNARGEKLEPMIRKYLGL
ncbi:hypothetical protein C4F40_04250 [Sphingobacterium sp. Ka21]|uniref:Alkyl hydroperoxide reductase subunit C/ Thiol specific antioxidant domain-containing protein n=1 Tax=Sphingobacterium pedocola TaxID=2082722 RepID=A0ABR9T3L7_9SPHI|nr:hypothetical protein [Sphingobacterium pedocola]